MYLAQYPLFSEEETTDNQRLPIGSKTTLPMSPRFLMMITYAWSSIRLLRQPALPRRGRHIIISLRVPFFEVLYYKRQPPQIVNLLLPDSPPVVTPMALALRMDPRPKVSTLDLAHPFSSFFRAWRYLTHRDFSRGFCAEAQENSQKRIFEYTRTQLPPCVLA
jgi:hypothetical protein